MDRHWGSDKKGRHLRRQEIACFSRPHFYSSLHIHGGRYGDGMALPGGNAPCLLNWNCFNVEKRFATRVIA